MISIRNVGKRFGAHRVLDSVSLEVREGEVVAICGPSGAGKTTLLRTINGLETVQEGEVRVNGCGLADPGTDLAALRASIGMVFQHLNLYPHLTVLENVTLAPRKVKRMPPRDATDKALLCLRKMRLEHKASVYPSQLSGGEQQRVAIARALAMDPKIMLLDEPTSALDPELIGEVLDAIATLADEGMTMVLVTHQMALAQRIAGRAVFMDEGRIVEIASPTDLVCRPTQERTRRFMDRIVHITVAPCEPPTGTLP